MGFMRTAMKASIARKLWSEAQKPQNQAKAKEMFNKITGKDGGQTKSTGKSRSAAKAGRRR